MRSSPDEALQGAGGGKRAGKCGKRLERRGPSRPRVTFLRPKASLREDETRVRPAVAATSLFLFGFLPSAALREPARQAPDGLIFTRPPPRRLPRDEGELRSAAYDRIFVRSEKGARPRDEAPFSRPGRPSTPTNQDNNEEDTCSVLSLRDALPSGLAREADSGRPHSRHRLSVRLALGRLLRRDSGDDLRQRLEGRRPRPRLRARPLLDRQQLRRAVGRHAREAHPRALRSRPLRPP